uniref:Uncharacterized protein n=1 Tax=Arundo donax TaxID=35708 RepID=A0A0A9HQ36_ARUDO
MDKACGRISPSI